ncbi:MAG: DUF3822 family protein [Thermoflexibacter sp.]
MEITSTHYQLIKHIKDDKFSVDEIYKYAICFKVSAKQFIIAVFDTSTRRCLAYEKYEISENVELIQALEQIYKDHAFISAGYWKKLILISTLPAFCYVPEEFFSKENAIDFLRLNVNFSVNTSEVYHFLHTQQRVVGIFAIEQKLWRWVKGKYPYQEVSCIHENSAFLQGVLSEPNELEARNLYALISEKKLTLLSFKQGNLHFLNTFPVFSTKDFVYYSLLVIEKLDLLPSDISIVLYGDVSEKDAIPQEIRKYVKQVDFGKKPKFIQIGFKFDEVPIHSIFDLLSVGTWLS